MGLDTSHGCWHGSYGTFNTFRRWIGKNIGINLDEMIGYGGSKEWGELKKHNLYPLLNHSDCDGKISPKNCKRIADGLDEMIRTLPMVEIIQDNVGWNFRRRAQEFRDGCLSAYAANESVDFH